MLFLDEYPYIIHGVYDYIVAIIIHVSGVGTNSILGGPAMSWG